MSCPFEDEVLLLQDNEMPFARRIVVEAHLAVCSECAKLEEQTEGIDSLLANGRENPLGVVDATLNGLKSRAPRWERRLVATGLIAATTLIVVFVWDSPPPKTPPRDPETAEVDVLPPPQTPRIKEQVAALDPDDREAAELLAGKIRKRGAAGTSALARLLDPKDRDRARRALAVAERVPSPRLVSRLIALMGEEEFAERAARLLGTIGAPQAVPALERALDGPASVEAREALVAISGRAAVEALARRLEQNGEESESLLDALARASARAGANQVVSLVSQPDKRAMVQRLLEKRRNRLLPELRKLVRASDTRIASGAARALGLARDSESLKLLASLARRRNTAEGATQGLLGIGTPAAYQAAFVAANWGGAPCTAAHCFDDEKRAEPFLLGVFESGTLKERRASLRLLKRCGGDQTAAFLARGQFGRSVLPDVADTLAAIGSDAAVKALAGLGHRREVLDALARIHTRQSARVLVELLEVPRAQRDAGRALATMPTGVVVPVLLESFERDPRRVRRVLTRIAGDNLGTDVEPWKKWWDERP